MAKQSPLDPYPRNRASIVQGFVGHKVTVSTIDFHYAVGRLEALREDDVLVIAVRDRRVHLPRASLASIQAADPAVAEYVK